VLPQGIQHVGQFSCERHDRDVRTAARSHLFRPIGPSGPADGAGRSTRSPVPAPTAPAARRLA
jgi:hypothetical protein